MLLDYLALQVLKFGLKIHRDLHCLLVSPLHHVFNPPCHLLLHIFDAVVESTGQMLHLEETLVDEGLALPRVDVLPDQRINHKFEHLSGRDRNVIPCLLL